MLQNLAFGLVAFARGLWKVGIFWEFFVKFAVFELVTLIIYALSQSGMCCCCFCLTVLSRKLRLRVVIDFLLFNSSWSKSCWNKIKNNFATLLSYAHPAHTFQTSKWQTEDHQNLTKDTVNLKLNGSRSNHWNLIQRCSNDSLWTKPCGILVFTIMSSTYCIAWTLLLTPDGKASSERKKVQQSLTSKLNTGIFMWFKIIRIHQAILEGWWYTGRKSRQIWAEWAVCFNCYLQNWIFCFFLQFWITLLSP